MERQEKYHEKLYDKSLTTYEAYRNLIKKTREILGKDMYILSCSGEKHPNITWAADIFDAARIGGDIFTWDEFSNNCVRRVTEFYHLHNILLYNDPDNIVLREEFNTYSQAVSRATFVSMLGLPITFGDELYNLSEERVEIIKRTIPSLDIRPLDFSTDVTEDSILVTDLCIGKSWENYNVVSIFNTLQNDNEYTLDLDDGEYLLYDFWRKKYLGCVTGELNLKLNPCETRVISIRKKRNTPQIVSTNRHITQGAAEIINMEYKNSEINLKVNLVKNDEYKIFLHIPQGFTLKSADRFNVSKDGDLTCLSYTPGTTDIYSFKIIFQKNFR